MFILRPFYNGLLCLFCFSFTVSYSQNLPVKFKSGDFYPDKNTTNFQNDEIVNGKYYRLLQFQNIPTEADKVVLKQLGITLLNYIPKHTYYAAIEASTSFSDLQTQGIAKVIKIQPEFKLSFSLRAENFGEWALVGNDKIALNAVYFSNIEADHVTQKLQAMGAEIVNHNSVKIVSFIIALNQLETLYNQPEFYYIEEIDPPSEPENLVGVTNHRSNTLATSYLNGLNYDGTGITVMLQDNSLLDNHIDYTGRFTDDPSAVQAGDHGEHCGGTIAGAGNLDPTTRGMAYGADVIVYDWGNNNFNDVPSLYTNNDLTITSKSYGNGLNSGYTSLASQLDQQIRTMPELVHVFSTGNSNGQGNTPAGSQWFNITGGHKAGKNVIAVGNLSQTDNINSSSSRGPARDGRIKPDICAVGTSVYSTVDPNDYDFKTGTSMACPGVAGTLAQLYQAYKDLNAGINPPSGLIKAAVLNTGEDLGNPGPDFIYGWGRINARRAYELISNNNYITDNISQGGSNTHQINVPAGTAQLRVMVYWTDYEGAPSASVALVNDIDMVVNDPAAAAHNPWVLNPAQNSSTLSLPAVTGTDHLNNMEQVTIDTPVAGAYTVNISGFAIPQGAQTYHLVYEFLTDDVVLTYPIGGEHFDSNVNERIRWDAHGDSGTFKVEYSTDNGVTWQTISNNVAAHIRTINWNVPTIVTGQALVKVTRGNSSSQSHEPFSIIRVPSGLSVVSACPDSMTVTWNTVTGATGYEVSLLGTKYMDSVGTTNTTSLTIYAPATTDHWWSVKALGPNNCVGRRAIAKYQSAGLFNCILTADAGLSNAQPAGGSSFSNCLTTNSTSIGIRINNDGVADISNIPVNYQLNSGAVVTETYSGTITPGSFFDYTFTTQAVPAFGPNQLEIWATLPGDINHFNDTVVSNFGFFSALPNTLPWSEDFESFSLCATSSNCEVEVCATNNGWVNDINGTADDIDWRTNEGTTPSGTTGPSEDFNPGTEFGNYMYLEVSSNPLCTEKQGNLVTPCIIIEEPANLKFAYHMYGSDMGFLHVDIFLNGIWTNDLIPAISGNQGDQWHEVIVPLGAYIGETVNFRFRGVTGDGYRSDMAIDDVSVFSTVGLDEQEATPGILIFPNPSTGIFNYTVADAENYTIEVVDMRGRVILTQTVNGAKNGQLELTPFDNGIYSVVLTTQHKRITQKIIKQ